MAGQKNLDYFAHFSLPSRLFLRDELGNESKAMGAYVSLRE